MFNSKKLVIAFGVLLVASMVLAACAPAATAPPPETIIETVVVTEIVEGEPVEVVQVVTPTPEPEGPRTLVICQGQEPETLYVYGGSMLAASHIYEAISEGSWGAFDSNSFAYQPTILEKIPSLADGDAVLNTVTVTDGDTVVDMDQTPVTLDAAADPPIMVVPAGGTAADAVPYEGGDFEMDQLVVTFKLLPGLMWSDGTPLTAADSVYAFNLIADPDTPTTKYTNERTFAYEAADDVTAVWTGLPGFKDATYYLNFFGPAPEHVWGQYTAAELLEAEESSRLPIGWGPYVIDEWVQGDNITMSKNTNYFRADEGLPKFETVVYRFVGENSNANIAAVLSGECDIVDQTSGLDDQSELLLELQSAGSINPTFVTGTVWEHIDFGIQPIDYDDGYQQGVDRPDFFSDARTRQAFVMCMDRQALVDTILFGQSIVIDTYLPPQHPLYNDSVTSYPFDPEAGSAMLEEIGWVDDDGDPVTPRVASGVEGVADGTLLQVAYETTTATLRQQVTAVIQQSLGQCGIQADIQLYEAGEWFADGPEGKLFGRRFDLGEFAWLTGVQPPCDLYLSTQTPGPPNEDWVSVMDGETRNFGVSGWGGQNDPGFADAAYDSACNMALGSLPGQPEYEQGHKDSQGIFAEQLPVAPLFLRLKLAATRVDMCNFIMDPTANSEFWNIENFDYGDCAGE
ncbi:MAG: peptide ABC transporter substrate-binding protein [Chloroflexota bacterium]|nr:MAG: peptide ABC transporter substrate-binding protein [Chloroflexota bacterium]